MKHETGVEQRLEQLPPKVAVPFRQLLASGQLSEDALAVILDAGEIAGENFKLLGFAVGYLHLRSRSVPVHDVIRMAKAQGRTVNLGWSEKRWKHEHDRLSRAETLTRLAERNVSYDVPRFEALLPKRFDGYLIRSSRRLGMEGLRQCHCVASYHAQLQAGTCAITAVFVNRQRWTVQLTLRNDDLDSPLRIVQIKSRFNEPPSGRVRETIHKVLDIPMPVERGEAEAGGRVEAGSYYMAVLRRVLPVLREHGVEKVTVAFDGSGDEGSIHSLYCEPCHSEEVLSREIEHPERKRVFEEGQWFTISEDVLQPVGDAIETLTNDYLEETDIDWYNDDGGFGELVIDVSQGTVSLDVSVRYTDSVHEFYRENDILTGEEL